MTSSSPLRSIDHNKPSTPRPSSSHRDMYKSTQSSRSTASNGSPARFHVASASASSPDLASGSRWHQRFTQQAKQRAKADRRNVVNGTRNGMGSDYVRTDRETREELAVLRKLAVQDKMAKEAEQGDYDSKGMFPMMDDEQLERLAMLEAQEYDMATAGSIAANEEEPPLDVVEEEDEDAYAELYEQYQSGLQEETAVRTGKQPHGDAYSNTKQDLDFDMLLDEEDDLFSQEDDQAMEA